MIRSHGHALGTGFFIFTSYFVTEKYFIIKDNEFHLEIRSLIRPLGYLKMGVAAVVVFQGSLLVLHHKRQNLFE